METLAKCTYYYIFLLAGQVASITNDAILSEVTLHFWGNFICRGNYWCSSLHLVWNIKLLAWKVHFLSSKWMALSLIFHPVTFLMQWDSYIFKLPILFGATVSPIYCNKIT